MKTKYYFFLVLIIIFFISGVSAQQSDISVTVYNQNLALVRDVRNIGVQKGEQLIQFQNVTAQIDPTSVHLRSLTNPNSFTVLEQNFEYDLVDSKKILRKYIDHEIELFTALKDTLKGTLLSSGNELVLALKSGEIRLIQTRDIKSMNFPRLPEGLITRPTLVWLVQTDKKQNHQIETEYLTGGLTWHAEYVSILNEKETQMDITAWVSVENNAGVTLKDAKLKLVAGDVNIIKERVRPQYEVANMMKVASDRAVSEKEFFEYHLYTINRRTTLNNNQVKQITLFDAPGVNITKKYLYEGQRWPNQVRVYTRFKNEVKNRLGMPFPAGKFRVYKKDNDESMIFLGEDRVAHTPKDEWIETYLGNAFDIKAERKSVSTRKIGNNRQQETFEIVIRNHKKEAIEISVTEKMQFRTRNSEWSITESSVPIKKKDATTVEFLLKIAKDKEVKLNYTVDYSW